jgi:ribulose-5-phosphate 4-epimerase/fuculose-1-phosphate aldolase
VYGLSLYGSFDGPVLDGEEGRHICEAMGPHGKGVILQNHGILTACQSVDSVVVMFMRLEQLCETQLLVDAAGGELNLERQEAAIVFRTNGGEEEAWRQAQSLYEALDEETGGDYKL